MDTQQQQGQQQQGQQGQQNQQQQQSCCTVGYAAALVLAAQVSDSADWVAIRGGDFTYD